MTNNHHMTTPKERMSDERLTDVRAMYGDFHAIEECLAEIDALRAERDEARAALAKAREDDLTGLELKFAERAEGQRQWISENAPYISHDQKHLDADTVERAYWYYGYCIALGDVVGQIKTTLAALTPTQESETP